MAEDGNMDAQYRLGRMYHDGRGVLEDANREAKWFRKAAEQGHPDAQKRLGSMYYHGRGVPKDREQKEEWYSKAAVGYLAWIERDYMHGEALCELRDLAKLGCANAQYNLGALYEAGLVGLPQHRHYCWNWYRKAARQGHEKARERLNW